MTLDDDRDEAGSAGGALPPSAAGEELGAPASAGGAPSSSAGGLSSPLAGLRRSRLSDDDDSALLRLPSYGGGGGGGGGGARPRGRRSFDSAMAGGGEEEGPPRAAGAGAPLAASQPAAALRRRDSASMQGPFGDEPEAHEAFWQTQAMHQQQVDSDALLRRREGSASSASSLAASGSGSGEYLERSAAAGGRRGARGGGAGAGGPAPAAGGRAPLQAQDSAMLAAGLAPGAGAGAGSSAAAAAPGGRGGAAPSAGAPATQHSRLQELEPASAPLLAVAPREDSATLLSSGASVASHAGSDDTARAGGTVASRWQQPAPPLAPGLPAAAGRPEPGASSPVSPTGGGLLAQARAVVLGSRRTGSSDGAGPAPPSSSGAAAGTEPALGSRSRSRELGGAAVGSPSSPGGLLAQARAVVLGSRRTGSGEGLLDSPRERSPARHAGAGGAGSSAAAAAGGAPAAAMAAAGEERVRSCIVVGAGIAGLQAAQALRAAHPDVLVLEAQQHVGGRVRQLHGFTGWPIEVGPEFVHGAHSKLTEVMARYGLAASEKAWPDYWYFGAQRRLTDNEGVAKEVDELHELFENVCDEPPPPPGADVSVEQWLRGKGATALQLAVADACYANDFGASLGQLGLREMIVESQRWDSGESYLIMDQSMSTLVARLAEGLTIRTGCPVTSVTHDAAGALLRGPGGLALRARTVVITASLAVLQAGRIGFTPPLPADKVAAIRRLRMGNAAKVIVAFSRRFWPERLYDVVCTDCFVPEFWMTRHAVTDPAHERLHACVGFIAGPRADALSGMAPEAAAAAFVGQLDEIFGTPADPRPASDSYVKAHVFDWAREPWVGGAYTFPSLGAEAGDRAALAAPVGRALFFAGEATHTAVNPCMQAALETGERAAREVLAALGPASRL
ncbi:PAO3 [Scenedesmus sp. PABB004]|nr:PAO3 [Scenedesmus sp. PABB004]